jgi:peroxiredoxin
VDWGNGSALFLSQQSKNTAALPDEHRRDRMSLLGLSVVCLWVITGLVCWVGFQLVLQNGRILRRLEALEQPGVDAETAATWTRHLVAGLPIGSPAPDFELPTVSGSRMTLSQWRGQRVLLMFFDPRCGFCRQMLPALAALPSDTAMDRPVPLILSAGDATENQKLIEEYQLSGPILLRERAEVTAAYHVGATPTGYLIDEQGHIASELAVGAQALLVLAGEPPIQAVGVPSPPSATSGSGQRSRLGTRSLATSRLNRDGLSRGTQAPIFRLPRLQGGELSLLEYRGRNVLLVFSDPECGPCDALAPELERLHRRATDLQLVMISRGDREANRAKAAEHGLTLPIALQRHWEVSRDYAMFATPIGYLIDAWGLIAADVAVGGEAILALARAARAQGNHQAPAASPGHGAAPIA